MTQTAHARTKYHAHVVHHTHGRLRVRLSRHAQRSHVLERLKHALTTQPGVHTVDVNHAAGSITIGYDPQQHSATSILHVLEDLDVIVGTALDVPHLEERTEAGGSGPTLSLAGALDDLNQQWAAWTGNAIDLRMLFPLGLVGLGLWQIRNRGLMLELLPGWLLVWLGVDAWLKLSAPPDSEKQHA